MKKKNPPQKCKDCGKVVTDYVYSVSKGKEVYRCLKCGGAEPDYEHECISCGQTPIVPITGMCGVCSFGESDCLDPNNW